MYIFNVSLKRRDSEEQQLHQNEKKILIIRVTRYSSVLIIQIPYKTFVIHK